MKQLNPAPEMGRSHCATDRFCGVTAGFSGVAVAVNAPTVRAEIRALNEPETIERPAANPDVVNDEDVRKDADDQTSGAYRAIIYNDDWHDPDDVVLQVQKATGYDIFKSTEIMLEAHTRGRAVCYRGARGQCQRVVRVLREIRLQAEVDCD